MCSRKKMLLLIGLFFLSYLTIYPKYNFSRFADPLNPPATDNTKLFQVLSRKEPLPSGGRFLVAFIQNSIAEIITMGKFDRKTYTKNNLYFPLFRKPIYHWLNITFGKYYDGSRNSVAKVSTFIMENFFMFFAFLLLYYSMCLLNLSPIKRLIGIMYLSLFTIYHTYYTARVTDISGILGWGIVLYLYVFLKEIFIQDYTLSFKKSIFLMGLMLLGGTVGVLLRESTIVPILSISLISLIEKRKLYQDKYHLFLMIGGLVGIWLFYSWPLLEGNNLSKALEIGSTYRITNIQGIVSIAERFLFPFLPHFILLFFGKIPFSSLKPYSSILLLSIFSVTGNFLIHFIFGAGLISECLGHFAPNAIMGAITFSIIIPEKF